jgi:glutamine synthetase
VLCDEYFVDGQPFHFSTRQLLRRQLARLAERGMRHVVGLEVEWYLARVVQDRLTQENIGFPGRRGRAIETAPVEPGYSYHSESNLDLMQPMLSELAEVYAALGFSLRSMENEWGPGQVECTFAADEASRVADDYVLFRSATRQVCRRHGFLASFMCFPGFPDYYSSGWHLHQSIADAGTGENLVAPIEAGQPLSGMGRSFLGGLLEHARAATVFSTPTVNGYRRFRPNSLAPDRVCWGGDHRGTLMRVLSAVGDPASRIENRGGEPAANPYLFIASQLVAGLDVIERALEPGPPDDDPYNAPRPLLPKNLGEAIATLEASDLFRREFGDLFIDYYGRLKQAELDRYIRYCDDNAIDRAGAEVTDWEQNEYWDFF